MARRLLAASGAALLLLLGAAHLAADDLGPVAAPTAHVVPVAAEAAEPRREPISVVLIPAVPSAATALDDTIAELGQRFRGEVGIAVRDVQTGWTSHHRGLDYFPQQSVSKLWVALSLLDQVDRGRLDLTREITVRSEDLTLFHQPIRTLAQRPGGFRTTIDDLLARALTQSDNSANDRLLTQVGGPDSVRATLTRKGISMVRFGPGERFLQSDIAGLEWRPEYRIGSRFADARAALPDTVRQTAFDAYIADPIDGATPIGIVDALARLKQGRLLSPGATDHMLAVMARTRTGAQRLKGGLRDGWTLSHKTGTGQIFAGEQAGYNDVGILSSPEGRHYAVAVLIGKTSRPLPERMKLMQRVVEATIDYDGRLARQRAAVAEPAQEPGRLAQ